MFTFLIIYILTLSVYSFPVDQSFVCPSLCECDSTELSGETSWAVHCFQGGIHDAQLADILSQLPLETRSLTIQPGSRQPSNNFRWNDNFNKFKKLRYLKIGNSNLPAMSRNIRLPSLEVLDLSTNLIEHATISNFGGLPKLRYLDVSNNRLSIMPTGVFTYVPRLQSLSIANNNMTDLSSNLLRGLRELKILKLSRNHISVRQLNELFNDVSQLEELHLDHCHMDNITNLSLHKVANIRTLYIGGNDLNTIPSEELRVLPFLSVLDVSFNQIKEIHDCAFCGMNISKLNLAYNQLGLSKQPFHGEAFKGCQLMYLDVSFNHLNEFHSTWLGYAQPTITSLSMSGNFVSGFNSEITQTLTSLKRLHMAYNGLSSIPVMLPPAYNQLDFLNISGNDMQTIPLNVPSILSHLKELDVSNNRLHSVSHEVITYLNELERVYFHNNPWDCSCAIKRLQDHMRMRNSLRYQLHYEEVRCSAPEFVRGHNVLLVQGINECAVIFGASYDLTQNNELFILLAAIIIAAIMLITLMLCLYYFREWQYKGSYITREYSRTPLTVDHMASSSSSSAIQQLSPPMPPPAATYCPSSYFGI